jgi:hypothetical protein
MRRSPDEVDGDLWIWSTRRGLNLRSTKLPTPWSPWKSSPSMKNRHRRAGNRTRDLMISIQKLWPLDHEAGPSQLTLYKAKVSICSEIRVEQSTQNQHHVGFLMLTLYRQTTYKDVVQWALYKLKSPVKNLGRQRCAEGFNAGVKRRKETATL